MYDNFLFRAKRTVYKWWNIDDLVSEAAHMSAEPTASAPAVNAEPDISSTNSALDPEEIPAGVDDDVLARANEIMARLNREAAEDEEKKQREIEAAKEKAAEQERLAAILKSTERNIDAFIQEGLSKQHQQDDGN